jgi:anti-anti-sigma factor
MFDRYRQGAVDVVTGGGPLHRESLDAARDALAACLCAAPPRVVFDMEHVLLVDGDGLELLLDTQDVCAARGGSLHLARPNALCRDILRVTGVGERFEVFDDVTLAVGSFSV